MTWGKRRALIIGLLIAFVIFLGYAITLPERIPANSVFLLDVNGGIDEQRPFNFSAVLAGNPVPVMHEYVDSIDAAARDPHINGLVVRIGPLDTGWAKLEEIRAHILAFRSSGKPSICYLGYDGIGNREYYLASACDKIWLAPTSWVGIRGMMAEALFLRGTLDKLKVVPDFYHIAEYKTYSNMFTEKKFTPAHREEMQSLLGSIYDQYLSEVGAARHIEPQQFDALLKQGPYLSQEAVQRGLVDRLAYWDQVQDYFRQKSGAWSPVTLERYRQTLSNGGGQKIAVVYASGDIVSGDSGDSPTGGSMLGGDTAAMDLRRARNDSSIKAIVLRVDSPGGSALASEVIRREVQLAKAEKPVVVSMSDVAASGGYWIAMSADKIVAEPNTITASIGVLGGKMNISGLYALLGLSTDAVQTSDNATLYSPQQNFTPAQRAVIQKSLEDVYSNFIHGVADGRHMKVEDVDQIGKGRVWTGVQAKQNGLVDELGDLDRAIAIAKGLAHIPAGAEVHLVRLPEEKSVFEQLIERGRGEPSSGWGRLQTMMRRALLLDEPVQVRLPFDLVIH